jgi:hypothetical protein
MMKHKIGLRNDDLGRMSHVFHEVFKNTNLARYITIHYVQ